MLFRRFIWYCIHSNSHSSRMSGVVYAHCTTLFVSDGWLEQEKKEVRSRRAPCADLLSVPNIFQAINYVLMIFVSDFGVFFRFSTHSHLIAILRVLVSHSDRYVCVYGGLGYFNLCCCTRVRKLAFHHRRNEMENCAGLIKFGK